LEASGEIQESFQSRYSRATTRARCTLYDYFNRRTAELGAHGPAALLEAMKEALKA
jgi:hypothetical protein